MVKAPAKNTKKDSNDPDNQDQSQPEITAFAIPASASAAAPSTSSAPSASSPTAPIDRPELTPDDLADASYERFRYDASTVTTTFADMFCVEHKLPHCCVRIAFGEMFSVPTRDGDEDLKCQFRQAISMPLEDARAMATVILSMCADLDMLAEAECGAPGDREGGCGNDGDGGDDEDGSEDDDDAAAAAAAEAIAQGGLKTLDDFIEGSGCVTPGAGTGTGKRDKRRLH